jgi:O-antigen ligase
VLLPFYGEKSAVSRFSLWQTGWKGIKESPITGLGLIGFSRQWETLNIDPGLATATHNFPHNIFLDLWVETGIVGLIGFIGLISLYTYRGLKNRQNILALGTSLFLIALVFSGLVDNPYFKNDLALVFWLILSLAI